MEEENEIIRRRGEAFHKYIEEAMKSELFKFEIMAVSDVPKEEEPTEEITEDIAERINIRYGVKSINESIKFYEEKIKELEKQRDELQKSVKKSYRKEANERITLDKLPYGDHMIGKNVRHINTGETGVIVATVGSLKRAYRVKIGHDSYIKSAFYLELLS